MMLSDTPSEAVAAEMRRTLGVGEVVTVVLLLFMACAVVAAYALDMGGWSISPLATSVLALAGAGLLAMAWRKVGWFRVSFDVGETLGWLTVVVGLLVFILWLAWPSLLPLSESSDTTHHASFTEFIMAREALAHDAKLDAYLGEMVIYPAGAHILAALVGTFLGVPGLLSLHPLLALVVSVKAGLIYLIILRLLPPQRRFPGLALAGTVLLLVPWDAFIGSFTRWYFFPMVVSETFAVGALWALLVWDQEASRQTAAIAPLTFYVACGVAVALIWPTWLPIVALTLIVLVLIRPGLSIAQRVLALGIALVPVAAVELVYTLNHPNDVGVLGNEGSVLRPSVALYSLPLLALAVLGAVTSVRNRRALPVWSFAIAVLAVLGGLLFLATRGRVAYYFVYKMFYLAQYGLVLFAALGLDAAFGWLQSLSPAGLTRRLSLVSWALALLIAAVVLWRIWPPSRVSVVQAPLYEAGVWAKAHVPNSCIDYVVDSPLTSYWLHVQVLGNPRGSPRTEAIVAGFGDQPQGDDRWKSLPDLPYAIVANLDQVPARFRSQMKVLHTSGPAAVVQREGICRDTTIPIERVTLASRGETLARQIGVGAAQP